MAVQVDVPAIGAAAPGFTVSAGPGCPCRLDDLLAEGPALLVFLSPSCPASLRALPAFAELDRRFGDLVPVIGLGDARLDLLRAWAALGGFSGVLVVDDSGDRGVFASFGLTVLPAAFLLDRSGTVVARSLGSDHEGINSLVAMLARLTGRDARPVSHPAEPALRPP